ncbi:formate/nitrite transporter family protein [Acidisoma silvae]|uniref:Formate/nitrite transporter family protein n=1 Tax=Acidisoma silvae TaxID=2802396 RepID=A0A963YN27_9PROT|nr:formate/nitrite transporter family protein [Acidisoma silvae]MCB8873898.1 formate/nitrite transporter family protein [Acidisoma silvae]
MSDTDQTPETEQTPHIENEAGSDSPHLDEKQQKQAGDRAPPGAIVIHEIVREQGIEEISRSASSLAWSGMAAGLSIGFSFVTQATLQSMLPDAPWRPLVACFGYSLGFLIVILGRQQLFTETTLTALIPALTERTWPVFARTMRVWGIVLFFNLFATWLFGFVLSRHGIMPPDTVAAMNAIAAKTMPGDFWHTVIMAGAAGWIIGLMVWLLPASGSTQPFIIILLTYTISVCSFPHIVAGSVEASYLTFSGHASLGDYLMKFLIPTLAGNTLGGTLLAALLNHAPVAEHIRLTRQQTP